MDRNTKKIYMRGAVVVLPVMAFVGCRLAPRACAVALSDRHRSYDPAPAFTPPVDLEAERVNREREAKNALAMERAKAKKPAPSPGSGIPAAQGFVTTPIATAQQMADALVVDAQNVAWLNTHAGEVVIAPRAGGEKRIVAKDQRLPQKRHGHGLALANGWLYWVTAPSEDDGAIVRAPVAGGPVETVLEHLGGLGAIAVEKDVVYFTRAPRESRDEDDKPIGGVFALNMGKKETAATRLLPAEMPCAVAVDDTFVYALDAMTVWRAPKAPTPKKEPVPVRLAYSVKRLGCSIAVDKDSVYWTMPDDDSVQRGKKTEGSTPITFARARTRPTNVVLDGAFAWILTETSPRALGEQGSILRVPIAADSTTAYPRAAVIDVPGLNGLAAHGGQAFFSTYNQAENDGQVTQVTPDEPPKATK